MNPMKFNPWLISEIPCIICCILFFLPRNVSLLVGNKSLDVVSTMQTNQPQNVDLKNTTKTEPFLAY